MKRTSIVILIAFIALCTLACAHNEKGGSGAPTAIREFSDPSQTIKAARGEKFSIVLDSNATTGYSWQPAPQAANHVVTLTARAYDAPGTNLAGAGGRERLTFQAKSAGTEKLTLHYLRPWEKNAAPAREVTFTIVVE